MNSGKKKSTSVWDIFWRNIVLVLIIVFVIGGAWWLGSLVGYYSLQDLTIKPTPPSKLEGEREIEIESGEGYPFYIYVGGDPCSEVAKEQYKKAKDSGVNRFVIEVPFPWKGSEDLPGIFQRLQCVYSVAGNRMFYLFLDLNPPSEWFQHGKDSLRMTVKGDMKDYVCFHSPLWKKTVEDGLTLLVEGLSNSKFRNRIGGIIMGFLSDRFWLTPGIDDSECAVSAFNDWLRRRSFGLEESEQKLKEGGITPTMIRELLYSNSMYSEKLFLPKTDFPLIEYYRRFFNESLADTAGFCAMVLQKCLSDANMEAKIYIPYGMNLEDFDSGKGQFSLINILESDIDGFILPISYKNRSLGESGGPSGTMESMLLHGKEVILWDDTTTGVSYDEAMKEVKQVKGVRTESVFAVQMRNFGMALVHNAGLMWVDPKGEGWLMSDVQWELFTKMIEVYRGQLVKWKEPEQVISLQVRMPKGVTIDRDQFQEEVLPRLQLGKYNTEELGNDLSFVFTEESTLWEPMVVLVDERVAHILTEAGAEYYSEAVMHLREQLLKVGLPVEFYLLQDLLDERIPRKLIYFIFSIYPPTENEIELLHSIFETDRSMVIWYLPICWDEDEASVNVLSKLTQTQLSLLKETVTGGSYFYLEGRWLKRNDRFGEEGFITPHLSVDDPEADVIALYQSNNKPSITVKTIGEKWVSVVYAEPKLDFFVLREIMALLEVPVIVDEGCVSVSDTILIDPRNVVIHTSGVGDRILRFNRFVTVENLFEPTEKKSVETYTLNVGSGETIFLTIEPK